MSCSSQPWGNVFLTCVILTGIRTNKGFALVDTAMPIGWMSKWMCRMNEFHLLPPPHSIEAWIVIWSDWIPCWLMGLINQCTTIAYCSLTISSTPLKLGSYFWHSIRDHTVIVDVFFSRVSMFFVRSIRKMTKHKQADEWMNEAKPHKFNEGYFFRNFIEMWINDIAVNKTIYC